MFLWVFLPLNFCHRLSCQQKKLQQQMKRRCRRLMSHQQAKVWLTKMPWDQWCWRWVEGVLLLIHSVTSKHHTLNTHPNTHVGYPLLFKSWLVSNEEWTIPNGSVVVVCECRPCGVKAASILYLPRIGCKSPSGAMASLSCGGPLKCLRIMGKKATAWRMNQSIEPLLSLTSSLPFSLSLLVQLSFSLSLPFPSSLHLPPRSVLSWNIYSSPGPASLNRHTNSQAKYSPVQPACFPICQQPPKHSDRPFTPAPLRSAAMSRAHYRMLLRRVAVGQEMHPRAPLWPASEALCCPLSCE